MTKLQIEVAYHLQALRSRVGNQIRPSIKSVRIAYDDIRRAKGLPPTRTQPSFKWCDEIIQSIKP